MNHGYLLIPCIRVSDCNLESSHLTASFPLTAAAGFIDRILNFEMYDVMELLGIDQETPGIELKGFSVCLHEYEMYQGITKNPLALCKGRGGKPADKDLINPPIIPEIKGRITFSLIMQITYRDIGSLTHDLFVREIKDSLLRVRFAGGDIISVGQWGKMKNVTPFGFYNDDEKLIEQMLALPSGWLIKDRRDLIGQAEEDKLQALLDAVAVYPPESDDGSYYRKFPGWLYAACTGYQMLEVPCERPGRRDGEKLHAYCEPVHSLAELIYAGKLLRASKNEPYPFEWLQKNSVLWNWQYEESSRLFELRAQ